jgi:hypothetical protein
MNQSDRRALLERLLADEHHARRQQEQQQARAATGRAHEPLRWERTHGEP